MAGAIWSNGWPMFVMVTVATSSHTRPRRSACRAVCLRVRSEAAFENVARLVQILPVGASLDIVPDDGCGVVWTYDVTGKEGSIACF